MPGFIGVPELMLLGLVVLLVFGPKRLPEMGRSLGRGMREFKDSVTGDGRVEREEKKDEELPVSTTPVVTTTAPIAAAPPVALAVSREREDVA